MSQDACGESGTQSYLYDPRKICFLLSEQTAPCVAVQTVAADDKVGGVTHAVLKGDIDAVLMLLQRDKRVVPHDLDAILLNCLYDGFVKSGPPDADAPHPARGDGSR